MPGPTAAARTVHPVRGRLTVGHPIVVRPMVVHPVIPFSAPDETLAAVQPDSDTSLTPTPDTPVIDDFPVAGPPRGGRTPRPSPDSSGDDAPTGTATGSEGSGSASGTDAGSSSDTSASGTSTETGETDSNTALVPRQPDPAP